MYREYNMFIGLLILLNIKYKYFFKKDQNRKMKYRFYESI